MICPHCSKETSTKWFKDGAGQCEHCKKIITYDATEEWKTKEKIEKNLALIKLLYPPFKHFLSKKYEYIKSKQYTDETAGQEIFRILYLSKKFTQEEIAQILDQHHFEEKAEEIREINFNSMDFNTWGSESFLEWLQIEITKIKIYSGQKSFIEIILETTGIIELTEDEMLNANRFRQKYFIYKGIMLTPIQSAVWACVLTEWQKYFGEKTIKEKASEETEAKEIILEYIKTAGVVGTEEREKALGYGFVYLKDNSLFLYSKVIKSLMKKNDLKITPEKLSFCLRKHLLENSKVIKISGVSKRFWVFNAEKLNMHKDLTIEEKTEEEKI